MVVAEFFGISIMKLYKDRHGYFRLWASGGITDFDENKILYRAKNKKELEKLAPEYFL
jgi:abortive infection bacteriophage resistance protein